MTDKEKMIKAYNIFMGRSDYENAYYAIRKLYEIDGMNSYKYVKEFRNVLSFVKGMGELVKRCYLITARDVFDDFMVYIEWNRPVAQQ